MPEEWERKCSGEGGVTQLCTIGGWPEQWRRSRKDGGRWNRQWEEGGRRPWRVINGRMVVGRLRHTRREQSDSNKVNLPPIHLPQPISRLTGRALHTLTNATLRTRAQAGVPHTAFAIAIHYHLNENTPFRGLPSSARSGRAGAQSFMSGDGCLRDQHYLIAFYGP